jgi:shikimate dehydrogenase
VDASPVSLEGFDALVGVIDAVYNPISTRLVLDARSRGIAAEGGLYMLVAQAVRAAELFSGSPIEDDEIERIYRSVLRKKQNVVLVGMPGVGKSTVGRDLGRALGRAVLDTDAILKSRIGDIPSFIKERGEAAFREEESKVVAEIASATASVIATGGGAILRQENVNCLLQNGYIYFLDRPLDDLKVYDNRPLSSTREALEARYRERYPIYYSIADVTVSGTRTREECVKTILEDFTK